MSCFSSVFKSKVVRYAIVCIAVAAGVLRGQEPAKRPESGECYGFAFGKWTPPLDWERSGHGAVLDSARVPRAPNGRGWAASDIEMPSDTSLLLFPPWWPAGILVAFKTKPTHPTDTVTGAATAFVADARKSPSTSAIRAWLVPCQSH